MDKNGVEELWGSAFSNLNRQNSGFLETMKLYMVCTSALLIQNLSQESRHQCFLNVPGDSDPWGRWRTSALQDLVTNHCHTSTCACKFLFLQSELKPLFSYVISDMPSLFLLQGLCMSPKYCFICFPLSVHPVSALITLSKRSCDQSIYNSSPHLLFSP